MQQSWYNKCIIMDFIKNGGKYKIKSSDFFKKRDQSTIEFKNGCQEIFNLGRGGINKVRWRMWHHIFACFQTIP